MIESGLVFEPFIKIFQKTEPMQYELYREITKLIRLIGSKICLVDKIDNINEYFNDSNMIPITDIELSSEIMKVIETLKIKEADILQFKKNYKIHFLAAVEYLISKSICNLDILKPLQFLDINSATSRYHLKKIIEKFPILDHLNEHEILDEFKLLQFEQINPKDLKYVRIDEFWYQLFDRPTKYNNLEIFV